MRKIYLYASVLATVALLGASVSTATAHKNGKGKGHKGPHGALVLKGKLAPVTGATGATGATGPTGATNVTGKAHVVQNRKKVIFQVHLRGLTPAAVYGVALFGNVDGLGCASTSNVAINPPAFKPVTADEDGHGLAKARVRTSTMALDPTAKYYVVATDASGATVSCGELKSNKKSKGKSDGKGKGKK